MVKQHLLPLFTQIVSLTSKPHQHSQTTGFYAECGPHLIRHAKLHLTGPSNS